MFVNASCLPPRIIAGLIDVVLLFKDWKVVPHWHCWFVVCSLLFVLGRYRFCSIYGAKETQDPLLLVVEDVENVPHSRILRNTLEIVKVITSLPVLNMVVGVRSYR